MTAITGKLQGHFSSVPHSAAPFGKQGVRWCQKNGFWGQNLAWQEMPKEEPLNRAMETK
jgi:hypothetical protein